MNSSPRIRRRWRLGIVAASAVAVVAGGVVVTATSFASVSVPTPTNLSVSAYGGGPAVLVWGDRGSDATGYEIFRNGESIGESSSTRYEDPRPDAITRYGVRGIATDDDGTRVESDVVEVDYVPGVRNARETRFDPDSNLFEFVWDDVQGNPGAGEGLEVLGYKVRREGHPISADGTFTTDTAVKYDSFEVFLPAFSDPDVTPGYEYWYYLTAVSTFGVPGDNLAVAIEKRIPPPA